MKKHIAALFSIIIFCSSQLYGAEPSLSDFLPPVQGGTTEVKSPGKVTSNGKTITADNAQDALNTALKENTDENDCGVRMVQFPSGIGWIATGISEYRTMGNPVATRISRRSAYMSAYMMAKTELAKTLSGVANKSSTRVRKNLVAISTDKDNMANTASETTETVRQAVDMLMRGFVIYQVKDDTETKKVYVSIVATTKTLAQSRVSPSVIRSDNVRTALQEVLNEAKSGLMPPVGGKIILTSKGEETAVVGFGSCIVRTSPNAAMQAKLNLQAQKIASMRSRNALCGMLRGDKSSWKGEFTETGKESIEEFESLLIAQNDDPLKPQTVSQTQKLEEARQSFVNTIKNSDEYTSAIKGMLPPGVVVKTWIIDDNAEVFSMAVYLPSVTAQAKEFSRQMRQGFPNGGGKISGNGFTDGANPAIKRPGDTVKPGVTGSVTQDGDL